MSVYPTSMKNKCHKMKVRKKTHLKLFSLANNVMWFMQLPSVVHQDVNSGEYCEY